MECTAKQSKTHCTCSCTSCDKHGSCCACVVYHRERGDIPGCFFTVAGERSLNRSLANFLKDRGV